MANGINTAPKRAKLEARKGPYWGGVSGGRGGVSLGYRKAAKGPGAWVAKIVVDGNRLEKKLGTADDEAAPSGALSYRAAVVAALERGQRQQATIETRREDGAPAKGPTVRSAIEAYGKFRLRRSQRDGKNAAGRLERHVLGDKVLADMPLAKLRASGLMAWRARLPAPPPAPEGRTEPARKPIAKASVNRLLNDLRAALNAAAETHQRELPPYLLAEIRVGTRAEALTDQARKQLLTDAQVRAAIEAAFALEEDGKFGRLVLLAATTGARYSQLAALQVGNVQPELGRVLMPGSKKGRSAHAKPPVAVPLSPDVMARLTSTLAGRAPDAPLLTRWACKSTGPFQWEKHKERALGAAAEIEKQWAAVVAKAGLAPDTIMYAFRHSSIVRGLKAGLPVRLVASLHDTSTEMIEKHYAACIVDMTEELARRAILSMAVWYI